LKTDRQEAHGQLLKKLSRGTPIAIDSSPVMIPVAVIILGLKSKNSFLITLKTLHSCS